MAANDLYTLNAIGLQVAQNYGATDDITLAKAYQWVNRALIIISEQGDWSWQFVNGASIPTVVGQEIYTLGSGVRKVYAMYYTSGINRKLRLIDNRLFRERYTYAVTPTGTPFLYRNVGRDSTNGNMKVALWPLPASIITLYYDYVKEMPLMSDTSSTLSATTDIRIITGMPSHMIDALIQLATAIAYNELDSTAYAERMTEAVGRWQGLFYDDTNEIDDRIRAAPFQPDSVNYQDPMLPPTFGP